MTLLAAIIGGSVLAVGMSLLREFSDRSVHTPDEVAPMILFLCSDAASFVAAGTFTCDGGMAAL